MVCTFQLSFVGNDGDIFRYKDVHQVDSFLFRTANVATQVEYHTFCALLFQVNEGFAHLFGAIFVILEKIDIPNIRG